MGSLVVVEKNKTWTVNYGLMNKEGGLVQPLKFEEIELFDKYKYLNSEHLYTLTKRSGDRLDFFVVGEGGEPRFPSTRNRPYVVLGEDRILRLERDKQKLFDIKGNFITDIEYSVDFEGFHEGMAIISDDEDNYGFMDRQGKVVVKPRYLSVSPYSDGLAAAEAKEPDFLYFLDKEGESVIDFYDYYCSIGFIKGRAYLRSLDDVYHVIDKEGNFLHHFHYDDLSAYPNSYLWAKKFITGSKSRDEHLLIDPSLKVLYQVEETETSNYSALGFNEGLLMVMKEDEGRNYVGYINEEGEECIPIEYGPESTHFRNGVCWLQHPEDKSFTLVDRYGNKVLDEVFYNIKINREAEKDGHKRLSPFEENLVLAERELRDGSRQLCIIHDKRLKLPLTLKRR